MSRDTSIDFNTRTIIALKPREGRDSWYANRDLPGFYVRVFKDIVDTVTGASRSGGKIFVVRYADRTGKRRYVRIGRFGRLTVEQATAGAKKILAQAELAPLGITGDPQSEAERRKRMPTWDAWSKTYFERLTKKRVDGDRLYLGFSPERNPHTKKPTDPKYRQIRARWANRPVDSITPEDIEMERATVRKAGKPTASRWLASISACLASAVRVGHLNFNPASRVKPDRANPPKQRVLAPDEMTRLLAHLDGEADVHARAALLLLVVTGARVSEILAARWEEVDLQMGMIRRPTSKGGKARHIPLPPVAVKVLKKLPKLQDCPFVIVGRKPGKPRLDLKGPWLRLITAAKLEGVTLHDLRRTFGLEVSRASGMRLASLGLGHGSLRTTESVYSPENFDAIRTAVEKRTAVLPFPTKKKAAG